MSVQRGFAMIAILALVALIAAFLIASALNRTAADVSNERADRSMSALRKAKAALIAYAANEQWQLYKTAGTYFQPGALPCPDRDDDGDADCLLPNTASQIGRVPFKTLGIDDLRDASGERLWYALSHDFRKLRCSGGTVPPNCTVINSDTQGQLTVIGIAPATQVVAVLFAPGEAIQSQTRDPANVAAHNDPLNYLEGPPNLGDPVNYVFTTALPSTTFNDRVLVITKAELMDAVEPVVAANIERDVKPLLGDYFSKWGAYPFAVPFVSPPAGQSSYLGVSGQTSGLLPLANTAPFTWQNATVTQIPPGDGTPTVTSSSCSISSLSVTCTVNYCCTGVDRPDIRLDVFLANANTAFADTPSPIVAAENLAMIDGYGNVPTNQSSPYGYWSNAGSPPRVPTSMFMAQAAGGALSYTGRLQNAGDMNKQATISFSLPAPPGYLPRLTNPSATVPNIDWFLSNQWYRQTYYAMSLGYAPGGVLPGNPAACNPPTTAAPLCLTVNNLPGSTNNKQAILVFAGRALGSQTRPSGNPKDYLEGANCNLSAGKDLDIGSSPPTCNLTTSDLVYEHRAGAATTINDRVVVVSP